MAIIAILASELLEKLDVSEERFRRNMKERWHQCLSKPFFDTTVKFTSDKLQISKQTISDRLGIDRTTLNRWLKNEKFPKAEKIFAIVTLIARCNLNDIHFEKTNDSIWCAVKHFLRSVSADLGYSDKSFPTKDQIFCLRNLFSNIHFEKFVSFDPKHEKIIKQVITQTIELQMDSLPNTDIRNGRMLIETWKRWGEEFTLFLASINETSFETLKNVK